jgi:hypothetical protein
MFSRSSVSAETGDIWMTSAELGLCSRVLMPSIFGRVVALVLVVVLLICTGCGPRSDRLPISGRVNFKSAPLDRGSIRFTSVGAERIMASGTMVQNGAYSISQEQGLRPGNYHVEISSPDRTAPPIMLGQQQGGRGIPVQPERIPAEYNVNSKLTIEVTADGANNFDFEIAGRPTK